ncbi:predicted protein [Streptomyces viridochromogenes DSM 40736]|uniref:Predicted protein n=1 Tax=Streptomyces viridochromogenes (strain DSM 40736 / JCM 4977 / BCRC 1201 / Tue 494) TaxID=591159 RepID=D9XDP0_STRVT|nr:predicted protein [Streptomyces viridochromogenes DSM 40736]
MLSRFQPSDSGVYFGIVRTLRLGSFGRERRSDFPGSQEAVGECVKSRAPPYRKMTENQGGS